MKREEIKNYIPSERVLEELKKKNITYREPEQRYKYIPDKGKCFKNKKNGLKFVDKKTGKAMPLYIEEKYFNNFEEVDL